MRFKHIMRASHVKSTVRRWAAFLLCAALVGGMVSSALPALAAVDADGEAGEETYCEHHPEHTEECGYVEAVEGQPCTHEHDDECGYVEAAECSHDHNEECGYVEGDEESCGHNHDDECGYAEAVECSHVHDDSCGYVEAVEGQPCQFVCDICVGGSEETAEELEETEEDSEQIAAMSDVMPLADVNEKGLIAYFTFDDSNARLHNYASGSSVTAKLHSVTPGVGNDDPGDEITDPSLEGYFGDIDGKEKALHLNDDACLVLGNTGAFNGLNELTVEMSVYISEENPQNWLFYAKPGTNANYCLGAGILSKNITSGEPNSVFRAIRENIDANTVDWNSPSGVLTFGEWHTIKVLYKISSMALYVDGRRVAESGAGGKTADFLTDSPDIWIGHSAFPNTNFKGYIDDIKIYNYAKDDYPINEQKYIITEDVRDPANTTVHMFDYWIEDQMFNDLDPVLTVDQVRDGGINNDHLFLFAGYNAGKGGVADSSYDVGSWNSFIYDSPTKHNHNNWEPFPGIVNNVLGTDGYPQLAIEGLRDTGFFLVGDNGKNWYEKVGKPDESLAYLFNLSSSDSGANNSKAVYPNVTGLFRLDEKGYYYFTSEKTFAELNREQVNRPKTSTGNNRITLYRRSSTAKDFFPFNDGTDLFFVADGGNLEVANDMGVQATTDEPLNHYFGMTVETKFKQPANGLIDHSGGQEPMEFYFSGDDDVWIFIDGVLVADVGGLHQEVSVTIDFSTGKIDFEGNEGRNDGSVVVHPLNGEDGERCFDTTLRKRFELADRVDSIKWNEDNNELFADGSEHTLKFFYLERGNAVSRCAISFNLFETEKVSTEWDEFVDESAEQPEVKEEAKTDGVLASPHTGDSKMVVVWITLLVFSITGVIVLYRTRKRENK